MASCKQDRRAAASSPPPPPAAAHHEKQPPGGRNARLPLVGSTCVQRPRWPPLSSTGVHWSQQIADSWDGGGRGKEFGAHWREEGSFEKLENAKEEGQEERSKPGV